MEILLFVLFLLALMWVSDKKRENSDPDSFSGVLWAITVLAVAFFILALITGAAFVAVTNGA